MASKQLGTYLNDHLAGSVMALELLKRLADSAEGAEGGDTLAALHAEIQAENNLLRTIIERVNAHESVPRKTAAWFAEKAAELKLRLDDPGGGDFYRLEAFEVLAVGIHGKRGLWIVLRELAPGMPEIRIADYADLIEQADAQRKVVEEFRLKAALAGLT